VDQIFTDSYRNQLLIIMLKNPLFGLVEATLSSYHPNMYLSNSISILFFMQANFCLVGFW